jgi:hypothetical protein
MTDTGDSYGYALFEVNPGAAPGDTVITMTYFHASRTGSGTSWVGTTSYSQYEQVVFGRGIAQPVSALPEFPVPAVAVGVAAVAGAGPVMAAKRREAAPGDELLPG